MENEKKASEQAVESQGKKKLPWDTGGCPFFFFGDEDSAEYDLDKMKKFFNRFKKKK